MDELPGQSHAGSSPQAWGTLGAGGALVGVERLIPTGVGNTGGDSRCVARLPAHPHRRGEHQLAAKPKVSKTGSSPQAWGTPPITKVANDSLRLIPTGVGNTCARPERGSSQAAHPTGVGNTPICLHIPLFGSAHPHRRGEHTLASYRAVPAGGSSPQAWGTRTRQNLDDLDFRLIPTGVGNTGTQNLCAAIHSAHPHRRGEHRGGPRLKFRNNGSSPQAWGTQADQGLRLPPRRLIPTGVGNTQQIAHGGFR